MLVYQLEQDHHLQPSQKILDLQLNYHQNYQPNSQNLNQCNSNLNYQRRNLHNQLLSSTSLVKISSTTLKPKTNPSELHDLPVVIHQVLIYLRIMLITINQLQPPKLLGKKNSKVENLSPRLLFRLLELRPLLQNRLHSRGLNRQRR
jgi:hypothetical protein